jgi:hypothetical protein
MSTRTRLALQGASHDDTLKSVAVAHIRARLAPAYAGGDFHAEHLYDVIVAVNEARKALRRQNKRSRRPR